MKTIIVSAGHHLKDPGAMVDIGGVVFKESELVMNIRDSLVIQLRTLGYRVIAPHDQLTLNETVKMAKGLPHDLAIDIHMNSHPKASGTEVFTNDAKGIPFKVSQYIAKKLSERLGINNRGVKIDTQSARGRLLFLRELKKSLLIEVMFMEVDLPKMLTGDLRFSAEVSRSIAEVIADGVLKFLPPE